MAYFLYPPESISTQEFRNLGKITPSGIGERFDDIESIRRHIVYSGYGNVIDEHKFDGNRTGYIISHVKGLSGLKTLWVYTYRDDTN